MTSPDVSVVVCTFNRAAMLRDALASLAALRTDGGFTHEVLVVDNGSTDETASIVDEAARRAGIALRGVHHAPPGVAAARNRGVAEAHGRWIAMFDDDQIAEPDWLAELVRCARQHDVPCAGGAVRLLLPDAPRRALTPLCRRLLGETVCMDEPRRYSRRCSPGAGNWLVHRRVFDEVGLFDETLTEAGEDTDLFRRMRRAGIVGWYTPHAVVWHRIPPQRLHDDSLLRTARRIGSHVARREWNEWPGGLLPAFCLARSLQWGVGGAVRRLGAALRGRPEQRLDARCRIAMAQGYLQIVGTLLARRRARTVSAPSRFDFRRSESV